MSLQQWIDGGDSETTAAVCPREYTDDEKLQVR